MKRKGQVQSRVVVVTGGSAGVGRAISRAFGRRDDKVAVLARGKERLEATRREIEEMGARALTLAVDVADSRALEAAAETIEQELGPIDIWINNAMTSVFSRASEMTPDEYRRVTEVTYLGTVYGTLAALRRMLPRDQGVIIQVGSALAYRGIPLQSAYCAAKHAIQGFTESVRTELYHDGSRVRITMVQLPGLNTPQFRWVKSRLPRRARPLGRIYQPEVAADAVVYAAEHERAELYVGSATVKAILGNRAAPRLLDKYLARVGVTGQQGDEPEEPGRLHNLWEPVTGDQAAHGVFDDRAQAHSVEFWLATHRSLVLLAGAGLTAAALARRVQRNGWR